MNEIKQGIIISQITNIAKFTKKYFSCHKVRKILLYEPFPLYSIDMLILRYKIKFPDSSLIKKRSK